MKVRAHAKINLGLNVVRKREDGYHELEMVMAPIELHDLIYINKIEEDQIIITTDSKIMPTDENNIMYKAAKLMKERYSITSGVQMHVYKHIPMQAGLAGGSTDCAAVLRAMNTMFHLNLSLDQLAVIGKELGADVPFCIYEKMAYVEGIGEKLTFMDNHIEDEYILLVKPKKGVSTKQSFGSLDIPNEIHPDVTNLKEAVINGDYDTMVKECENTLQRVSIQIVPQIQRVIHDLEKFNFDVALMSGSGSCCFGITKDEQLANQAMEYFRDRRYYSVVTHFYRGE